MERRGRGGEGTRRWEWAGVGMTCLTGFISERLHDPIRQWHPLRHTHTPACQRPETTTMRELILTASGPVSTPQSGSILFHDILNGSSLASFKQSSSSKNCTAIINSTGAQGGLMLAVQPDKSLLNVYSFQKVLLYIQDPASMSSLTFPVLRIKSPSRSSSPNDHLASP